jgi:hypothetical protein
MNYPAASYGVSNMFRHAGLDPASSLSFLDSGVRRMTKPRQAAGNGPKEIQMTNTLRLWVFVLNIGKFLI